VATPLLREWGSDKRFEILRVPQTWKGVLFVGKDFRAWCCAGDEGWPFVAALAEVAANHHMLRWLKTVVLSDVEKAHKMCQVGIGKTVRSPRFRGSLLTCRYSIR
jgi:hypothetical protein